MSCQSEDENGVVFNEADFVVVVFFISALEQL